MNLCVVCWYLCCWRPVPLSLPVNVLNYYKTIKTLVKFHIYLYNRIKLD